MVYTMVLQKSFRVNEKSGGCLGVPWYILWNIPWFIPSCQRAFRIILSSDAVQHILYILKPTYLTATHSCHGKTNIWTMSLDSHAETKVLTITYVTHVAIMVLTTTHTSLQLQLICNMPALWWPAYPSASSTYLLFKPGLRTIQFLIIYRVYRYCQ
jgi:hypothetical protein